MSAATGVDVVVLGTTVGATELASSNETVTLSSSFGKQALVHFDTTTTGHDSINFGFFGSAKYNQTPSTANYDVRIQSAPTAINDGNLHVILVDNGTTIKVYSASANGAPVLQGDLSVLGFGGQANGGTLVSASTLLNNGVFGNFNPSLTPTVSLSGATAVNEGQAVDYFATLSSAAPAGGITVPYTLTGISLADLTGATALTGNITIPAGTTTGKLTLTLANDTLTEGPETLNVTISTPASGATLGTVKSILTAVTDTSKAPSGDFSIDVAAAGTHDAKLGNVIYNVANTASNFTYTIDGFNVGDKLSLFAGSVPAIQNPGTSADGNMIVTALTPLGGQVTINLTGLALVNDTAFNPASFNGTFGPGSLVV